MPKPGKSIVFDWKDVYFSTRGAHWDTEVHSGKTHHIVHHNTPSAL